MLGLALGGRGGIQAIYADRPRRLGVGDTRPERPAAEGGLPVPTRQEGPPHRRRVLAVLRVWGRPGGLGRSRLPARSLLCRRAWGMDGRPQSGGGGIRA